MRFYENRLRELEAAAGRPEGSVRLMAVTKTVPPEKVNAALRAGAALVGENRVQELMAKKISTIAQNRKFILLGTCRPTKFAI